MKRKAGRTTPENGMKFYELAIGAVFHFRGKRFAKTAMSMAEDEKQQGNVFAGGIEIAPVGSQPLLPPEEAAKWKPSEIPWTDRISPAPGQR